MKKVIVRNRKPWVVLFLTLLLSTALERRLAELDFNWTAVVRIENDEEPAGDEIINRLVLIDDMAAPALPVVSEANFAEIAQRAACARSLLLVHRSDSRGPPAFASLRPDVLI